LYTNTEKRDQEIREVYRYMRRVRRHESAYVLALISRNYFLSVDRVWKILAREDSHKTELEQASKFYQWVFANAYYTEMKGKQLQLWEQPTN